MPLLAGPRATVGWSPRWSSIWVRKTASTGGYYDAMVDAAVADISQYGDFEWFVSDDPYVKADDDTPPWFGPGEPYGDDATAFDVR